MKTNKTFHNYLRYCKYCNALYPTVAYSGKVCPTCKIKNKGGTILQLHAHN